MPLPDACLTPADLDRWAQDTNGAPFTDEAKDELKEFLDVNDDGNLTCVLDQCHLNMNQLLRTYRLNGFIQIYQLQTENDEEETWRDLVCDVILQEFGNNDYFSQTMALIGLLP